jgi:hypothetical protein
MSDLTRQHELGNDDITARALEAVREDDRTTAVPTRVEEAVMRAWDTRAMRTPEREWPGTRAVWAVAFASAACLVFATGLWFQRSGETKVTGAVTEMAVDPLEGFATAGVLLQDDRASLQLVRMAVEPSVLAAYGFPLANPTDTQPVHVDMLIGLDGIARALRPVENGGIGGVQ